MSESAGKLVSRQVKRGEIIKSLVECSEEAAYVLVGDPGMGKSTALWSEATRVGGMYLHVRDFLSLGRNEVATNSPGLFIDNIDEWDGDLAGIRGKLAEFGWPTFRLGCRTSDWYRRRQPLWKDNQPPQLLELQPLTSEQQDALVATIDHDQAFVALQKLRALKLDALLGNPQLLLWTVPAAMHDSTVTTRTDVLRVTCNSLLQEHQPYAPMRDTRSDLEAVGKLATGLLLTRARGLHNRNVRAPNAAFVSIADLDVVDPKLIESKLFHATNNGSEFVHRMLAEYLAADWLHRKLEKKELTPRRLYALLAVHNQIAPVLRGLACELAARNESFFDRVVREDPLTLGQNIDGNWLARYNYDLVRRLFLQLRESAMAHPADSFSLFFQSGARSVLQNLRSEDADKFILSMEENADVKAAMVSVYGYVKPSPLWLRDKADTFEAIAIDDKATSELRLAALRGWLATYPPLENLLKVAAEYAASKRMDLDATLRSITLVTLVNRFGAKLHGPDLQKVLTFVELPDGKPTNWLLVLLRLVEQIHVDCLPDLGVRISELGFNYNSYASRSVIDAYVLRCLQLRGERITAEKLFELLMLGLGEHSDREAPAVDEIGRWLVVHPTQYRDLLRYVYAKAGHDVSTFFWLFELDRCLPVWLQARRADRSDFPTSALLTRAEISRWYREEADVAWNEHKQAGLALNLLATAIDWQQADGHTPQQLEAFRSEWIAAQPGLQAQMVKAEAESAPVKQIVEESRQLHKNLRNERFAKAQSGFQNLQKQLLVGPPAWAQVEAIAEYFDVKTQSWSRPRIETEYGLQVAPDVELVFDQLLRTVFERDDIPSAAEIVQANRDKSYHFAELPLMKAAALLLRSQNDVCALPDSTMESISVAYLFNSHSQIPAWLLWCDETILVDALVACGKSQMRSNSATLALFGHFKVEEPLLRQVMKKASVRLLEEIPLSPNPHALSAIAQLLRYAVAEDSAAVVVASEVALQKSNVSDVMATQWQLVRWLAYPTDQSKFDQCCNFLLGKQIRSAGVGRGTRKEIAKPNSTLAQKRSNLALDVLVPNFGTAWSFDNVSDSQLATLIAIFADNCEHSHTRPLRQAYSVTDAMSRGDALTYLVKVLAQRITAEAAAQLQALRQHVSLKDVAVHIDRLLAQQHESWIELESLKSLPTPAMLRQFFDPALNPVSVADAHAVVVDELRKINEELQTSALNRKNLFWKSSANNSAADRHLEEQCRDVVAGMLKDRLGQRIATEVRHIENTRADASVGSYEIPIEFKRDDNADLWTAWDQQVRQYTTNPLLQHHAIYCVIWFGTANRRSPKSEMIKSAAQLATALEGLVRESGHDHTAIVVIDVSRTG